MRRTILVPLAALLLALAAPAVASAGGKGDTSPGNSGEHKTTVCHREGNGSFHLITVDNHAVPAHMKHGDVLPDASGHCPPAPSSPPPPPPGCGTSCPPPPCTSNCSPPPPVVTCTSNCTVVNVVYNTVIINNCSSQCKSCQAKKRKHHKATKPCFPKKRYKMTITPPHSLHGAINICVRGPGIKRVDFEVDKRAGHTDRKAGFCWKVALWDTRIWGKQLWGWHTIKVIIHCKGGGKPVVLKVKEFNSDPA
jgi:hypothetical protein